MKREHEEENPQHRSNSMTLPKLHNQTHNSHHHTPPPHLRPPASEEADSRSSKDADDPFPPAPSDGATIEVVRRPRGRPPGSKNKPKPPVVITQDAAETPSMSPYVLELPAGVDVVESTARFCRRRNTGLVVLNGNGAVANVTIRQPSTSPAATVTFHGRFDILSISATVLPAGGLPGVNGQFTISLAGPQGQVVGGLVVGPLVSAATIYLIAATFNSPSFERLQQEEAEAGDGGGNGRHESPKASSGGDSGGAPMYNYQPPDVIWVPTARQPPQQQPPTPPY